MVSKQKCLTLTFSFENRRIFDNFDLKLKYIKKIATVLNISHLLSRTVGK